jgi:hypothetical protein
MIALGNWQGCEQDVIIDNFDERKDPIDRVGVNILFAWYDSDSPWSYSGAAFLLFKKDGEYYTVDGSHCSCYGFEGQWTPVRVTLDYLKQQLVLGLGIIDETDYYNTKLVDFIFSLEN